MIFSFRHFLLETIRTKVSFLLKEKSDKNFVMKFQNFFVTLYKAHLDLGFFVMMFIALASAAIIFLSGCASDGGSGRKTFTLPDSDTNSTAHGAAFTGSWMFARKPMTSHADWKPTPFYFKVCDQTNAANYYSRTSYSCNEN